LLRPKLTRLSVTAGYESSRHVFAWLCLRLVRPSLAPHIPALLPPCLILLDDYRLPNQLLGLQCIKHVVANTPLAVLRCQDRAEVIYHAIHKHLYSRDAQLLQVGAVRHMKLLLPTLISFLQTWDGPDGKTRQAALDSLTHMMRHAWPRYATSRPPLAQNVQQMLLEGATECLVLLDRASLGGVKVNGQNACSVYHTSPSCLPVTNHGSQIDRRTIWSRSSVLKT
uniref:Uncharacterized protein n=1 Tax=Eptatretus burgeri TaxID=7764 RepID=A0A8C4R9N2_EPTBU